MRVEFYVLPTQDNADRLRAACRLALKAWRAQMPIAIRCATSAEAQQLDQLLWEFRGDCFLPHNLITDNPNAPILISSEEPLPDQQGLLINLHPQPYPQHQHFVRIIEIVNQAPQVLQQCRDNFIYYRQLQLNPQRVEL